MNRRQEKQFAVIILILFLILSMILIKQRKINNDLRDRIAITERINEEQQAFIRNHRIDHLDIQEQFNLHTEQLGLIWNRIP